jgi:glycosyltransferase involved in cell wall biosynthesis
MPTTAAADVFITTPWYEPFGITPVEAMACGTPVVGSAVGGIKATVKDGRTGYLVPPNDPEALASRLADLLRDQTRLRAFGRNAVREARAHYTWNRVAGAMPARSPRCTRRFAITAIPRPFRPGTRCVQPSCGSTPPG